MALDWLIAKLLTCKLLTAEWDQLQDVIPDRPHWLVDAAYLVKSLAVDPTQQSEACTWTAWLPANPVPYYSKFHIVKASVSKLIIRIGCLSGLWDSTSYLTCSLQNLWRIYAWEPNITL